MKIIKILIILVLFSVIPVNGEENADEMKNKALSDCIFIADTAYKFINENGREPATIRELKKYIENISEMLDPYGNQYRIDSNRGLIFSSGKDGLHSRIEDKSWQDDISVNYRSRGKSETVYAVEVDLNRIREALLRYNMDNTREIYVLKELEKDYLPEIMSLKDPWGQNYILDTSELIIYSKGNTSETETNDRIVFSWDTESVEMKTRKTRIELNKIAKKLEEYYHKNKSFPEKLEDIIDPEKLKDSFGNSYKFDTNENLIYSSGIDGVTDRIDIHTTYDDLKCLVNTVTNDYLKEKNKELTENFRRDLLNYICFEGKFPVDYDTLMRSGYLKNKADAYGNKWIIDYERKIAASSGYDGVYTCSETPDGDDILIKTDLISKDLKIEICREILKLIAEKFTVYEINEGRTLENLLPLMHSDYIPQIFRMTDPWGERFRYHRELKFVYSYGPDKLHSVNETSDWLDDLTLECGLESELGKKLNSEMIVKKNREIVKSELKRLATQLRKRDVAIGRKKLNSKTLGRPLRDLFNDEKDIYGEKYHLNFKEKIIFSSGPDKIKSNEDDLSLCWKNIELPKKETKKKTRRKKKKRRR